jgi:OOP family OmpA-OmpF porin
VTLPPGICKGKEQTVSKHAFLLTVAVCAGLAGCQSVQPELVMPVVPPTGERVIVNHVVIIADASGSMYTPDKFPLMKELLRSFVAGMPDGAYDVGVVLFGGEQSSRWPRQAPELFDRNGLLGLVNSFEWMGGSTPLATAIERLQPAFESMPGRTAVVILSDGKSCSPAVLEAATNVVAFSPGQVCIHTVQFGQDAEGRRLLANMATLSQCGSFRHANDITASDGMAQFIRDVFLGAAHPAYTGAALTGGTVYFDFDKAELRPADVPVVEAAAGELSRNPALRARIEGHTDDRGPAAYNVGLSKRRAETVVRALSERGVAPGRVDAEGYGETQPAAPNTTPESRQLNRRAEIFLLP